MPTLILGKGIYIHNNGNNLDNRKQNLSKARGHHNQGKVYMNGYIAVYMPEHKRAFNNGCVYEHILVAENMLGRELKQDECVHHIDKNRTNNDKSNLMVFSNSQSHIMYHAGVQAVMLEDGSYICNGENDFSYCYNNRTAKDINDGKIDKGSITIYPNNEIEKKKHQDLCPICKKNYKSITAKKCLECYNKERSRNIPNKLDLEKLIYDLPFSKISELYNVSDKTIPKWCKKYNLPYRKKELKLK